LLKDKCIKCHAPRSTIVLKMWNGDRFDSICVNCANVLMECSAVGLVMKSQMPDVFYKMLGECLDEDSRDGN